MDPLANPQGIAAALGADPSGSAPPGSGMPVDYSNLTPQQIQMMQDMMMQSGQNQQSSTNPMYQQMMNLLGQPLYSGSGAAAP